jgi:hypothetical protein
VGVNVAVITDDPTATKVRSPVLVIDATAGSADVYVNVPAVSAVGGVTVKGASPSVAETSAKAERAGVLAMAPTACMAKCCPAQVPLSADHEEPALPDARVRKVGVGLTSVVGAVELHFQPIVPPEFPVTTMK